MAVRTGGTLATAMLAMAWILAVHLGAALAGPAPATQGEAAQRRGAVRAEVRGHVEAADAALLARRPAEARERIERAETILLNLRGAGGARAGRVAAALGSARAAIDRGAFEEARAALGPLLARSRQGKA